MSLSFNKIAVAVIFVFFIFLFSGNFVDASVEPDMNWYRGIDCNMFGESGSCYYSTITVTGGRYYQIWSAGDTVTLFGGAGGASWCVSNTIAMWFGSCWSIDNVIGEGGSSRNIGFTETGDYGSSKYIFNMEFYANDARWVADSYRVSGRHVGTRFISGPTNQTGPFNFTWTSGHAVRGQELFWSGPISCSQSILGPDAGGSATCTPTGEGGPAQVRIEAYGYDGLGFQVTDSDFWDFNVAQPAPGPFNLSSSACYGGPDANGNGKFDLSWTSSANATSYDIYAHAWSGGAWGLIGNTTGFSWTATHPVDTDWYFKVVAKNGTDSTDSTPNNLFAGQCVSPSVSLSASPNPVVYNTPSTLTWSSTNTLANSCSVKNTTTGATLVSSQPTSGSVSAGNLTSAQTYKATCQGLGGISKDSNFVTVNVSSPPPPSVDMTCGGNQSCIISWNTGTTLGWSVSGVVDSCTASGDWGGAKSTAGGSEVTGNLTQVKTYSYALNCSGPGGGNGDTVNVTVSAPIPNNPASVTATPPDYCVSGPAATITWTYSDPSGSPQSAYEVQMDEQGSFQVPEYQTGKVLSNSNSNFTGQGVLLFNKTYKTRVRVWNGYDAVSDWTVGSGNFNTPPYAYPQVDFSWTANGILNNPSPPLNKPVDFTDATVFNGNPNGRRWDWLFGDGGTSTTQNPSHTYSAEGSYYVTLTATDNANQSCARSKGPLIIQKPIPRWREVAPQ